jgi:polygalacturonase
MSLNYCWNVKEMGASGTENTNDTQIIQKAIDECSLNGGVVYFPPGTYSSGHLILITRTL